MIASLNPRVLNAQLHLCISANGRSHNKMQLTEVAEQWLDKMGYGENPYLIYFHSDTSNNHVHIVSTRVDKNGKKIPSFYEKNKGLIILHHLIGLDGVAEAKAIAIRALQYGFTSVDQYRTILKSYGYFTYLKDDMIHMVRYTKRLFSINLDIIQNRVKEYQNSEIAINSLRRIFSLFLDVASGQPYRQSGA
ncbi:Relaxase/Mobilization nuclease domain protein [compost metagenome]